MNTKRIALMGCFLFSMTLFMSPLAGAEDIVLRDLYLESGSVSRCGSVSKGLGDFVWCNEGANARGYPVGEVDTKRTFDIQMSAAKLVNQSKMSFEDGDWDEAIRAASAALALDPQNEVAYNNRGYALERSGDLPQALENYVMSCRMGNELGCSNVERVKPLLK